MLQYSLFILLINKTPVIVIIIAHKIHVNFNWLSTQHPYNELDLNVFNIFYYENFFYFFQNLFISKSSSYIIFFITFVILTYMQSITYQLQRVVNSISSLLSLNQLYAITLLLCKLFVANLVTVSIVVLQHFNLK